MFNISQGVIFDDLFFAHDENGDAVTGLVDGDFTKRISKNGAAFGDMTVTITERGAGWYHFQLSASHTDTEGALTIYFAASGAKQVNLKYKVTESSNPEVDVNMVQIAGNQEAADRLKLFINSWRHNTAQSGVYKSVVLAAADAGTADLYLNWLIILVGGTGAGQARIIGDYNQSTNTITIIGQGFYPVPDNTTEYILIPSGYSNIGAVADNEAVMGGFSDLLDFYTNEGYLDANVISHNSAAKTEIRTEVTNALNTYDPPTKAELDAAQSAIESAISAISGMTPEEIKAALVEALTTDTYADPTTPPPDPASLADMIKWVFARSVGVFIQDAVSQTLRNRDDSATIAQRTVTASPTQAKLDEWQP